MKKAHELRDLPLEELEDMVRDKSEELMTMRLRVKMQQLDNPLQIRFARREIARIKTLIHEKRKAASE